MSVEQTIRDKEAQVNNAIAQGPESLVDRAVQLLEPVRECMVCGIYVLCPLHHTAVWTASPQRSRCFFLVKFGCSVL